MNSAGRFLCTNCGYLGRATRIVPGSNVLGIFLLFFFILPGLIYAVWQQINSGQGCPVCKHTDSIIPESSPRAKQMIASGFATPSLTTILASSQSSASQSSSASVSVPSNAPHQTLNETSSNKSSLVIATVGLFVFGIIAISFYSKSTPASKAPAVKSSVVVSPQSAAQSTSAPETTVTITTAQEIVESEPRTEHKQTSTESETVNLRGAVTNADLSAVPQESWPTTERAASVPRENDKKPASWNDVMAASNFYDAADVIKSHCKAEWPNNPSMFEHCTKRQHDAVRVLDAGRPFGADQAKWNAARVSCASEWPTDYVMRLYCEEKAAR